MLSRQVAPLPRKFCKVGAYFTIASQRGHALTMLRSFKVILTLVLNTTWPTRTRPKLPARQQYHQSPKGARLRQRPCREYFERLVNAGEHPARIRKERLGPAQVRAVRLKTLS